MNYLNYLASEEKLLLKVLKIALKNANTIEELNEANRSIGYLLFKIPKRL